MGVKVQDKTKYRCNGDELLGDIKDMEGVIKTPVLPIPNTSLLYIDMEVIKKDTPYRLNCVNERLREVVISQRLKNDLKKENDSITAGTSTIIATIKDSKTATSPIYKGVM